MGLRQSIRGRVVVVVLTAFAAIGLIAVAVLATIVSHVLRTQAQSTTSATAGWIAEELTTTDPKTVVAEHVLPPGSERVIQILDADGRLVAATPPGLAPLTTARGREHQTVMTTLDGIPDFDSDNFALAVTGAPDRNGAMLTVAVASPASLEEGPTAALVGGFVLTGIGLLMSVWLGVLYAVDAALRPVEAMRAEVQSISDIGSSRSVAIPDGEDEFTRLATTLNDLLDRLRTSDAARRAFVADAGHELRSPLAAARVTVEHLAIAHYDKSECEQSLAKLGLAIDRLSAVVDDLFVLARLGDPGARSVSVPVDLDDVTLNAVRALPGQTPVSLELAPARVLGDAGLLDRVVRNLLDNALRHADSAMRVRVENTGESAVLTVDNDGAPVPEHLREMVFQRFVRLDEARDRDRGGSGLGLAVVADTVARYGGRVHTNVADDGWCRFVVDLPLAASD